MQYLDGRDARIGDIVEVGENSGRVVMLIREGMAADGFVPEEWSYLEGGVLVDTRWAGLIHFPEDRLQTLHLKARAAGNDLHG